MDSPSFLDYPLGSPQVLTVNSSVDAVDDASVVALLPSRVPPSPLSSAQSQPTTEHSITNRIAPHRCQCHTKKKKADSTEPDFVQQTRSRELSVQDDFICEECRQIDFQKVLKLDPATLRKIENWNGIFIADLGTRCNQTSGTSCALCRVFSAVRIPADSSHESQGYQLRAYSLLTNSHFALRYVRSSEMINEDQPYLSVVPSNCLDINILIKSEIAGCLFCYTEDGTQPWILAPQIVPRHLDYNVVVEWLDYCRLHHKRFCGSKETQSPRLKLIDCDSLSVRAAPTECSYAALSYVWGRSMGSGCNGNATCTDAAYVLPASLPNVILDAITVTKALGLRYLWVDKYCIDQDNHDEKHEQISHMDAVYKAAEITIIAAAGQDEDSGLPGVGAKLRRVQPTARLGNIRVVSSMADPHYTIRSSTWSTRGWTYQEAVLSRRRLVFTEDQIYFECNAMNCYESLRRTLDILHTKEKSESLQLVRPGIFSGIFANSYYEPPDDNCIPTSIRNLDKYFFFVEEYTARHLRFEEDSLKAFGGIIKHLERSEFSILQMWGIPFLNPRQSRTPEEVRQSLVAGLLWTHRQDCWSTSSVPYPRSGFPSWSWAGWAGQVKFVFGRSRYDILEPHVATVHLEFEPGCLVEHVHFFRNAATDELGLRRLRALHLDVWVVSPGMLSFCHPSDPYQWYIARFHATLSLSQGLANPVKVSEMFSKRRWELLLFATNRWDMHTYLMVIEQYRDSASRVGLMTMVGGWGVGLEELRQDIHMEQRTVRLV